MNPLMWCCFGWQKPKVRKRETGPAEAGLGGGRWYIFLVGRPDFAKALPERFSRGPARWVRSLFCDQDTQETGANLQGARSGCEPGWADKWVEEYRAHS